MKLEEIRSKIKTKVFSRQDLAKLFPDDKLVHINTQLYRMIKRGDLMSVKRGLYMFPDTEIDEFVLANKIYTPSYVSLESVLNLSGIIPDIPSAVTSVATVTSKKFHTSLGDFIYSKLPANLFFGFMVVLDQKSGLYYNAATPEKALLDFIYLKRIRDPNEYRIDMEFLDKDVLFRDAEHFPKWVRKVVKYE